MSQYGLQMATHLPCPKCDSSDAFAIYKDSEDENRYYGICYSKGCTSEFDKTEAQEYLKEHKGSEKLEGSTSNLVPSIPTFNEPKHPYRNIQAWTLKFYSVSEDKGAYHFPFYAKEEEPIALKTRLPDKRFVWTKTYPEAPREAGFFGQQCAFGSSRKVLITEGEIDAMSAYQMLSNTKWGMPVVSLKNGAGDTKINDLQKEFLDKFDTIYLCFDADEAGRKAAKTFSQIFPPEKIRMVNLEKGHKDANDYLKKGHSKDFMFAVQIATPIIRQGMVLGIDTLKYMKEDPEKLIPYPYKGLNDMLYGISSAGELITILSGSGLGKSTLMKSLGLYLQKTMPEYLDTDKIGGMFLEENKRKTTKILTGMNMNKNLLLPHIWDTTPEEDWEKSWNDVFGKNSWIFWDQWGSNTVDSLIDNMRYMVANFGAKVVLFDHISILLSGGTHGGNERQTIDELMTKLRALINELEFTCIAISHLTKGADGTPHEEGGRVKLAHARGAGSIYQLSDTVIGLERNGQDENAAMRNITHLRVLKSRLSGETGPACKLVYNKDKGTMRELTEEEWSRIQGIQDPDEAMLLIQNDFKEDYYD